MGQYYHGVMLDAKTRKPIMATYPKFMKMIETGLYDVNSIVYEVSKKGHAYKQRVTYAGDYSERKDYGGVNLWEYIHGHRVPEVMSEELKKHPITAKYESDAWFDAFDKFYSQYVTDDKGIIRDEFRYLCNHDRKEWIDLMPFYTADDRLFWNPIAILTSDVTCRCQGSGDYEYKEDFEWYGAWDSCILSAEAAPPDGYKRISPTFPAKTGIACDDPMLEHPPVAPAIECKKSPAERLREALASLSNAV